MSTDPTTTRPPVQRLVVLAIALLCTVALAIAVRMIAGTESGASMSDALGRLFDAPPPGLVGTATGLGVLLIGAWILGEMFDVVKVPKICGYLVFGVLAGPRLAAMFGYPELAPVGENELGYLKLVEELAIALIALVAGGEIRIELIRSLFKRLAILLGCQIGLVLVGATLAVFFVIRPMVEFLSTLDTTPAMFCALVMGTIAVANSPAIVIAMIKETDSAGEMCDTALAATVLKDLILIVLFTILLALGVALLPSAETVPGDEERNFVGEMLWHLLGSIGMGAIVAIPLGFAAIRIRKQLLVFMVVAGFAIALVSDTLHFASLLVGLTAGFTLANVDHERTEPLFHETEKLLLPVYCVFFAVAGASIDLDAVSRLWPIALLFVGIRGVLVWAGTTAGARLGGTPAPARNWVWTAFTPQAGVTIALTIEVSTTFTGRSWTGELVALLFAIIAIHEIAGPILMRLGLARTGELGAANARSDGAGTSASTTA